MVAYSHLPSFLSPFPKQQEGFLPSQHTAHTPAIVPPGTCLEGAPEELHAQKCKDEEHNAEQQSRRPYADDGVPDSDEQPP